MEEPIEKIKTPSLLLLFFQNLPQNFQFGPTKHSFVCYTHTYTQTHTDKYRMCDLCFVYDCYYSIINLFPKQDECDTKKGKGGRWRRVGGEIGRVMMDETFPLIFSCCILIFVHNATHHHHNARKKTKRITSSSSAFSPPLPHGVAGEPHIIYSPPPLSLPLPLPPPSLCVCVPMKMKRDGWRIITIIFRSVCLRGEGGRCTGGQHSVNCVVCVCVCVL